MWLITFEAFPNPKQNPDDFKEFGGAYVNCWIDFALENGAVELAKFYIKQNGWKPHKIIDENVWFDKEDCETTEQKIYFDEAIECGATLVWHKYPFESEEIDEDFELEDCAANNKKLENAGN